MTFLNHEVALSRRAFVKNGVLTLAASSAVTIRSDASNSDTTLRVGLMTDLHYADKSPAGTRHYRETLGKLEEAGQKLQQSDPAFVVELGDLIDAANSVDVEKRYLKTINARFSEVCRERHYVLGNHCVDTLTKSEFLERVEQQKSYYSFDRSGYHFVVLDSCFRNDGQPYERKNFRWTDANVPQPELEWLTADLAQTQKPVVVFAHQRLDVRNNHGVKNNAEVRSILEQSGRVLAVFQGHSHRNDLKEINGIHYCTLRAMVEGSGKKNSGYSLLDLDTTGTIRLSGFLDQKSYDFV